MIHVSLLMIMCWYHSGRHRLWRGWRRGGKHWRQKVRTLVVPKLNAYLSTSARNILMMGKSPQWGIKGYFKMIVSSIYIYIP